MNRFNLKATKPRSTNANLPLPVNNPKKKIDNVNSDFIRYISEREDKKGSFMNPPQEFIKNEEEEE